MIDNKLIESALWLTWKSMESMTEINVELKYWIHNINNIFSMEKFCYYLLSESFIQKYADRINWDFFFEWQCERVAMNFWKAIYEYQSWNEQPLIDLLSKIK